MHKATQNRPSPVVHVQDLVLDPDIDNSLSQSLSYYGVTPASAPYPHHLFSPNRGTSREYSLSRELNARISQLDDYTDSLSAAGDFSPPVKIRKQGERNEPEEIKDVGSLLTMDDETSLDTYINEIKEAEGGNGGMPVPLKKKTSKQKNGNNQTHLTVRYHNLGNWPAESKEPKAYLITMQLNEMVIFRETILQALRAALRVMDKKYWMYCVERIKATDAGHTIKSETLVTLKNQLFEAQKHVAVLVAHARSLAIEIIEKVTQLRALHGRNVKTSATVSIYWKGANYLLKIKNDMEFINDTPTMRIWLGFAARELIIPPHATLNNGPASAHDPKGHWLRTHHQIYLEWFKRHEAYILASWKAGKSKVIFKSDRKFLIEETSPAKDGKSQVETDPAQASATPGTSTPDGYSYTVTPSEPTPGSFPSGQNSALPGLTPLDTPGLSPRLRKVEIRDAPAVQMAPSVEVTASAGLVNNDNVEVPKEKKKLGIAVSQGDVLTPLPTPSRTLEERHETFPPISASPGAASAAVGGSVSSAAPTPHARPVGQTPSPFDGLSKNSSYSDVRESKFTSRRSSASSLDAIYAAQLSHATSFSGGLLAGLEEVFGENTRSRANTTGSELLDGEGLVGLELDSQPHTPAAIDPSEPNTPAQVEFVEPKSVSVKAAAGKFPFATEISALTVSTDATAGASNPAASAAQKASSARTALHRQATLPVGVADPSAHTVPEWQQLKDYARHSWGAVEIEEEVDDTNNAFIDYKRGFHDRLHGINDSRGGFNDHKHTVSVDYMNGFHDAKRGFSDAVEGFEAFLASQQQQRATMTLHIQGKGAAPAFWKTVDHNPLVVQAATGFEECFPSIYLVPPMPADLLSRAEKCSMILRKEMLTEQAIAEQRVQCRQHKESVLSMVSSESIMSLQTAPLAQKSLDDAALLKLRQQGSTELLTGFSVQHLSHTLSVDASSLASLVHPSQSQLQLQSQSQVHSRSQVSAPGPNTSQTEAKRKGGNLCDDDGNNVFLTNSLEDSVGDFGIADPNIRYESSQQDSHPENSVLYPNMQTFGSYIDTTEFKSFRIEESSKLRHRIEERIADGRRIVEYKEGEIFPVMRPEKRGIREPNHASVQWQSVHAITMQRVIRGFLGRRRARKTKISQAFQRSLHKVRTLVVGFMWRYRQREKYWENRFEAFMMRKTAVKKFRGSMTLARFFRKIVRARRQMREDDERERLEQEGVVVPGSSRQEQRQRIAAVMTPVSRNVRRRHGHKLIEDGSASPMSQGTPQRSARSGQSKTTTMPERTPNKAGKRVTISTEDNQINVLESTDVSMKSGVSGDPNTAAVMSNTFQRPAASVETLPKTPPKTPPKAPVVLELTPEPNHRPHYYQSPEVAPPDRPITPQDRLRRLEAAGPYDESKRREQLKFNALNLIARVNRGKVQTDTLHNSRLIPTQTVPNLPASNAKMRKFATKEYAFMNMPAQARPESLIKSSSDVFLGPIPKRVPSSSASASRLQLSSSLSNSEELGMGSQSFVSGGGDDLDLQASLISSSSLKQSASRQNSIAAGTTAFGGPGMSLASASMSNKLVSAGSSVISTTSTTSAASMKMTDAGTRRGSHLSALPNNSSIQLDEGVHYEAGVSGGALLRYNSSGLTVRSKKQQLALEKAEAERMQLRNTLLKYM